jgi:hypothetical protein
VRQRTQERVALTRQARHDLPDCGCGFAGRIIEHAHFCRSFQMLYDLLTSHREELIAECKKRVAKRYDPAPLPSIVDHAVPLFLEQLVHTLRAEGLVTARSRHDPLPSPVDSPIGRGATAHGIELLRLGYTVDQVVHHYGDVCQTVTDLGVREGSRISSDEFRTLNRCLDEAIADAVTAFGEARETAVFTQSADLHDRLGRVAEEQRRLVALALQTFNAIQTGKVGTTGQTGVALTNTLTELRDLIDRALPEIRLVTGVARGSEREQRSSSGRG